MVEQNRSGVYTQFVYSPTGFKMQIMSGQSATKLLVPLPGGGEVVYNASGMFYYHSDHLGSFRFGSSYTNRNMYFDLAYAPFGETYATSGSTDPAFTGQRQDTVSGLYDFPAREYSIQGRWPSPDPAGLAEVDPTNPQSWNRYAYVMNNPLAYIDPTGLCNKQVGPACADPDNPYPGGGFSDGFNGGCYLNDAEVDCGLLGIVMASPGGYTAQCPNNNCGPYPASNGTLYPIKLTADGFGYVNPNNGDTFSDGSELGLPNLGAAQRPPNLPLGTPRKYWGPFLQGYKTALKDLKRGGCGAFFGGLGPDVMSLTTYRFLDLGSPTTGARTLSATDVRPIEVNRDNSIGLRASKMMQEAHSTKRNHSGSSMRAISSLLALLFSAVLGFCPSSAAPGSPSADTGITLKVAVTKQEACAGDSNVYTEVLTLTTHYMNTSDRPIYLFEGTQTNVGILIAKTPADLAAGNYEARSQSDVFPANGEQYLLGQNPIVGRTRALLSPGRSLRGSSTAAIVVSKPGRKSAAGTIDPGEHWVIFEMLVKSQDPRTSSGTPKQGAPQWITVLSAPTRVQIPSTPLLRGCSVKSGKPVTP